MRPGSTLGIVLHMRTTYAVLWQEADEAVHEGRLELEESGFRLESPEGSRQVSYRHISEVRLGEGRIGSREALALDLQTGERVRIASVVRSAIISELAKRLAGFVLAHRKTSRLVVVLPIREAAREQVSQLLTGGPPFDLDRSGLDGHHVFLTDTEVIFVFEGADRSQLQRLAVSAQLVAAAEAWEEHAAGPARLAEEAFSWSRPDLTEGLSFAATPGPGDSDGGDLYPP
jgi:hypothetical protein